MPKANLYNMAGEQVGEVELSEAVFGIEPNEVVLHAAVKNHLANRRQGTQSALTKVGTVFLGAIRQRISGDRDLSDEGTVCRIGTVLTGQRTENGVFCLCFLRITGNGFITAESLS